MSDKTKNLQQKTGIYFSAEKYKNVIDFCNAEGIQPKNYTELIEYLMSQLSTLREYEDHAKMNFLLFKDSVEETVQLAKSIEKEVFPFLLKTNDAFRSIFQDESFEGLEIIQLIELMRDFCERDPTNEFPLQEAAEKVYNQVKETKNEITDTKAIASEPETRNRPIH